VSGDLRASDAEREQAVARLREASAEGRLTLDELVARTGVALEARTRGDLERVTADLPAAAAVRPPARTRPRLVLAVFAPVHRRNRWRLCRQTFVVSLFGPTSSTSARRRSSPTRRRSPSSASFAPVTVTLMLFAPFFLRYRQ
jgi:hypothetical protein